MADQKYPCPCCGTEVADEYVEGDSLCCYCRDINDPRLAPEVRRIRERAIGPRRCCLRRLRGGQSGHEPQQGELFLVTGEGDEHLGTFTDLRVDG